MKPAALATKPQEQSFHHEPMTPEQIAENAKWADELTAKLSAGKAL